MKLPRCFSLLLALLSLYSWTTLAQDRNCTIEESLQPGDANRDFRFDVEDLLQVLRGGKFASGEPASWEEGDWNGDAVFSQLDIVAALQIENYLAP